MTHLLVSRRRCATVAAVCASLALVALPLGCSTAASHAPGSAPPSSFSAPSSSAPGSSAPEIPASASAAPDLEVLQSEFQSIAARISPSVVAISAATTPDTSPAAGRQQAMNPDELGAFLSTTTRMVGAGFFISQGGYILTNDHVIDGAQQLWVTTDNKTVYPALVVGSDPRSDLAVLKIPADRCPALPLAAAASPLRRGQWSLAIGNPFGLGAEGNMCLSVGVVSATDRSLARLSEKEDRSYYDMIQTTAQINPGSSGGPLLDLRGDVIGINTAVVMPAKSVNGIGFAIPITPALLETVQKLRAGQPIDYAYLGVATATATEQERQAAGVPGGIGAKVTRVYPDSPAATGELREQDVITAIDDQPVTGSDAFTRIIGNQPLDRPVLIDFVRDGCRRSVALVLRKRGLPADPVTRDTQRLCWAGLMLANHPAAATASPTHGVVVCSIDPASPFADAGLHEGSVITTVAGRPVDDLLAMQIRINQAPVGPNDLTQDSAAAADMSTASLDR